MNWLGVGVAIDSIVVRLYNRIRLVLSARGHCSNISPNKATAVWRGCLHCFIVSLTSRSVIMMKLLIPSVYEKLFVIRDPHICLLISHDSSRLRYILLYTCGSFCLLRCPVFRGLCGAVWSDAVAVEPRILHPVMVHLGNSAGDKGSRACGGCEVVKGFREAPLASKASGGSRDYVGGSKRLWNNIP